VMQGITKKLVKHMENSALSVVLCDFILDSTLQYIM
jgi:hypothetical protein